MRTRHDRRLDLRGILECGLAWEREHGIPAAPADGWHDRPDKDGVWRWHVSELGFCARSLILRRAGLALDGQRLEGALTMEAGKTLHRLVEHGIGPYCEQHPEYELIGAEVGMVHPTLPLKGKPDLLYRYEGAVYAFDLKSESNAAAKWRRSERQPGGTAARYEHQLQVAGQAFLYHALHQEPVADGFLGYVDRELYDVDVQDADLWPSAEGGFLPPMVPHIVADLEAAWERYTTTGQLPRVLPSFPAKALCKPRGANDERGFYCEARSSCLALQQGGA